MLFNLNRQVLIAVVLVVALLTLGFLLPQCHAAPSESTPLDAPYVQLSGGEAVIRGQAPALDLTFTEPAQQLRGAYWQQSLTVIGESTYNFKPSSPYYGKRVPNNFIARTLFVDGLGHFDVGLGLSWMQNPYPYNGSPINFALQLAYRFSFGATLTYAHMSNAGSKLPNLGRDVLLVGWRFH